MRDYYEILGVERTATAETIKKAYRRLALQYHPDRNPDDKAAEDKFKEATEAYGVLSDTGKRARYDQFGHAGVRGAAGGGPQDFSSIFDQFRDIFGAGGSAFDDIFGGQQRRGPQRGRPGSDLRIKLPLTLEEIALGADKKVRVRKFTPCDVCAGAGAEGGDAGFEACTTCSGAGEVRQVARSLLGQFVSVQPCPTCGGEGRIPKNPCRACNGEGRRRGEEDIPISVPPGVLEGHYLTLRNAGNAGQRGGEPGDLRVEIEEVPHEHFRREGLDVVHDLFLSVPDALLGTEADVPTLEGSATLKIEPGTPGGKILRLRGRGLPELGGRGHGDELVRVNVWMPPKLTPEELVLVERLRTAPSFQERPANAGGNGKTFFERVKDVFTS